MEETHFTQNDRKTLEDVSKLSIRLETMLNRAITDIAGLSNSFVTQVAFNDLQKQVDDLKGTNKWIMRTVGAMIIAAVMGLILLHK